MKKVLISMLALLMMGNAYADDRFSVDDITLPQNSEAPLAVKYSLDEGNKCSGFTFWIELPEGLSVVSETTTAGEEVKVTVPFTLGDCYSENPTFTPNLNEGYLKVACMTAGSDPLTKPAGTLATFRITSNGTLDVGSTYKGKLHHATISDEGGGVHDVASIEFTITIGDPVDLRTILDETSPTAPEAATGVDVRVKRTIKPNEWSTICLPFAMTAEQVTAAFGNEVKLGDFTGCTVDDETGNITVNFTEVTAIEANHPYIIKVKSLVEEFTADGVDIAPEEEPIIQKDEVTTGSGRNKKTTYNNFIGNYVYGTLVPDYGMFLADNKFWFSTGETVIKAFRCYFDLVSAGAEYEEIEAARIAIAFEEQTTGVTTLSEIPVATGTYSLSGLRVQKPSKGIYVRDGKKVVIK
jgi:hypothetical protein